MFRWLLLLVVLCLPLGAVAQTADQPTSTIGVEDNASQDAAMAVRIRDILAELDGFGDVTVTVSSGIVTLRGTTLEAAKANSLNDLVARVEGVVAIENDVVETTDVVERLNPAVQRFMARMWQLLAILPLLTVAVLAFVIVVFVGWMIAKMRQPWDRIAPNAFIADIYRILIRLAFAVGGLVIALDILNATALLSTILGAAGIIGLAIGFAVKDTVENFIASIMLSIRQPFRPNDTIEIGGDIGKVIRLTSRATIMLSFDGNHIRIPNSTVFKSRIVNYSRNDERRFLFDLGIAPDADLAMSARIALETLEGLPFVLSTPAANAWLENVGDSTVTLRCVAWIAQHETSFVKARSEAIRLVMTELTEAGIGMPEPTYILKTDAFSALPDVETPDLPKPEPVVVEAVQDVGAEMEHELEAIVDDERAETQADDLLKRDAPDE